MCSVSEREENVDIISVVEAVRARREDVFRGFGVGMESSRGPRRGWRTSMSDGSKGGEIGERREEVRVVRRRVVWVRCDEREVCAVINLFQRHQYIYSIPLPIWFHREAPFSTPAWLPRSFKLSATRCIIVSASLPLASVPLLARCSMAAIRASSEGDMPSVSSGSLP